MENGDGWIPIASMLNYFPLGPMVSDTQGLSVWQDAAIHN